MEEEFGVFPQVKKGIFQDLFIQGVKLHVHNNPAVAKKLNMMLTTWNNEMLIDRFDVRHLCDTPSMLKSLAPISSKEFSSQHELACDYYFDPDLLDALQFERYQDYIIEEDDDEGDEVKGESQLDSFSEWNQSSYISNRKEIWTKSEADAAIATITTDENKQALDTGDVYNGSDIEETQCDFEMPVWYTKFLAKRNIDQVITESEHTLQEDSEGNCIGKTANSTGRINNWTIPSNRKIYQVILHTAKTIRDRDKNHNTAVSSSSSSSSSSSLSAVSLSSGAGTQLEILLKVKQVDNPLFDFLLPHNGYHEFYRYLKVIDESSFLEILHEELLSKTESEPRKENEEQSTSSNIPSTNDDTFGCEDNIQSNALSFLGSMYNDDDDSEVNAVDCPSAVTCAIPVDDHSSTNTSQNADSLRMNGATTSSNIATNAFIARVSTVEALSTKHEIEEGECSDDGDIICIDNDTRTDTRATHCNSSYSLVSTATAAAVLSAEQTAKLALRLEKAKAFAQKLKQIGMSTAVGEEVKVEEKQHVIEEVHTAASTTALAYTTILVAENTDDVTDKANAAVSDTNTNCRTICSSTSTCLAVAPQQQQKQPILEIQSQKHSKCVAEEKQHQQQTKKWSKRNRWDATTATNATATVAANYDVQSCNHVSDDNNTTISTNDSNNANNDHVAAEVTGDDDGDDLITSNTAGIISIRTTNCDKSGSSNNIGAHTTLSLDTLQQFPLMLQPSLESATTSSSSSKSEVAKRKRKRMSRWDT